MATSLNRSDVAAITRKYEPEIIDYCSERNVAVGTFDNAVWIHYHVNERVPIRVNNSSMFDCIMKSFDVRQLHASQAKIILSPYTSSTAVYDDMRDLERSNERINIYGHKNIDVDKMLSKMSIIKSIDLKFDIDSHVKKQMTGTQRGAFKICRNIHELARKYELKGWCTSTGRSGFHYTIPGEIIRPGSLTVKDIEMIGRYISYKIGDTPGYDIEYFSSPVRTFSVPFTIHRSVDRISVPFDIDDFPVYDEHTMHQMTNPYNPETKYSMVWNDVVKENGTIDRLLKDAYKHEKEIKKQEEIKKAIKQYTDKQSPQYTYRPSDRKKSWEKRYVTGELDPCMIEYRDKMLDGDSLDHIQMVFICSALVEHMLGHGKSKEETFNELVEMFRTGGMKREKRELELGLKRSEKYKYNERISKKQIKGLIKSQRTHGCRAGREKIGVCIGDTCPYY